MQSAAPTEPIPIVAYVLTCQDDPGDWLHIFIDDEADVNIQINSGGAAIGGVITDIPNLRAMRDRITEMLEEIDVDV
jgi:hypothetical protein